MAKTVEEYENDALMVLFEDGYTSYIETIYSTASMRGAELAKLSENQIAAYRNLRMAESYIKELFETYKEEINVRDEVLDQIVDRQVAARAYREGKLGSEAGKKELSDQLLDRAVGKITNWQDILNEKGNNLDSGELGV